MPSSRKTRRWWLGLAVAAAPATVWWLVSAPLRVAAPAALRGSAAPLSIAAAGDTFTVSPWPEPGNDLGFDGVVAVLQGASLAVTNLEQVLQKPGGAAAPDAWPIGSAQRAADLRRAGFTVIARANNHGADQGDGGLRATAAALDAAGLLHTGAGADLDEARAAAFLGEPPRRVAVMAVATSASDEARATRTRDEIQSRPGVSALRYTAEITADPATYATLAGMAHAAPADANTAAGFHLSGRLIRKGPRTSVELVADARDRDEILDAIASARATADVVVVTVHSHEPGNLSPAPADFVRDFAHRAIDRGAAMVVGTGPRQLRGIEIYQGRVIFYSLGNFAFEAASIPRGGADVYDANTNLNELALDGLLPSGPLMRPEYSEAVWWESVVATTIFEGSELQEVRLQPIDLGADASTKDRGRPRIATRERGLAILGRLVDLSKAYGTTIRIENGIGLIGVPAGPARH